MNFCIECKSFEEFETALKQMEEHTVLHWASLTSLPWTYVGDERHSGIMSGAKSYLEYGGKVFIEIGTQQQRIWYGDSASYESEFTIPYTTGFLNNKHFERLRK